MIRELRVRSAISIGFAMTLAVGLTSCNSSPATPSASPTVSQNEVQAVAALGRIEPEGEVIRVSVPNAQDSRVNQLLVKEGDRVQAGQVIAVLQGVDRRSADLRNAEATQRLRQAELKKVRQGDSKQSEVAAQKEVVRRLELEVRNQAKANQKIAAIASAEATLKEAQENYKRRERLVNQGALPKAELDILTRVRETAEATVNEKKAELEEVQETIRSLEIQIVEEQEKLNKLNEVRPIDVEISQAQLDQSEVTVEQRQADLDDVKVRAPIAGQVLRINTRIGEQVNVAQGIIELAKTDRMFVIAEVAESDIPQVKRGQKATITTDYGGFGGEVSGTVEQVSLQIGKRTLEDAKSNPSLLDSNARIVEAKIRINPSENSKVSAFTGMQVRIKIQIKS